MEKTPTGVQGLDELLDGGFHEGSINLVTGKTGTGKSIFCAQFLYNGAAKHGESGLYITTEETAANVRKQAANFGWDLEALEKKGVIRVIEMEPFSMGDLIETLTSEIDTVKAKRVVIDSVSMFELYMQDAFKIRKSLFKILETLRKMGKTTLVTAEVLEESAGLSRFGVIEFMVDTVILLQYLAIAKYKRSLTIRKMRMGEHSTDIHPFDMTPTGIEVYTV